MNRNQKIRALAILIAATASIIAVSASQATSINLKWKPSTAPPALVAGYEIYTGSAPGLYSNHFAVGNVLTYTINNILPGTNLYIAARTIGTDGSISNDYSNEVEVLVPAVPVALVPLEVVATSSAQSPADAIDGNTSTRWATTAGDSQRFIEADLGAFEPINSISLLWYRGDRTVYNFGIQVSGDRRAWSEVFRGVSAKTAGAQAYNLSNIQGRYVRIVGYKSPFAIAELVVNSLPQHGSTLCRVGLAGPCQIEDAIPIAGTTASKSRASADKTIDLDLGTKWSVRGSGEYLQLDLGVLKSLHGIDVAWASTTRFYNFEVAVSSDGVNWSSVLQDTSSLSDTLERYNFTPTQARYVRLIGFGNQQTDHNEIAEVVLLGIVETL